METFFIMLMLAGLQEQVSLLSSELEDIEDDSSSVILSLLQMYLSFCFYCAMREDRRTGVGRLFWVYPRSRHWWDEVVRQVWVIDTDYQLTRDSYVEHFGMRLELFDKLALKVEEFMPPPSAWLFARDRIPFKRAFAVVLFRLASGSSLKVCSNMFCIGRSTVVKYTGIIVHILSSVDGLYSKYVGIPRGERLRHIIRDFEVETNIPGCMGAIDGTHIQLRARPDYDQYPADYWCHKGFHSVVLQGIYDHQQIFWSLSCHIPGSQPDPTHLRMSRIWQYLNNEGVWEDAPRLHLGDEITMRPFIVGDSTYPIMPWLMKKISQHQGPLQLEDEFDTNLCATRVVIENAFGALKGTWKICSKMIVELADVPRVVTACVVLHNFVRLEGVQFSAEDIVSPDLVVPTVQRVPSRVLSRALRTALFRYWVTHHRVDPNLAV